MAEISLSRERIRQSDFVFVCFFLFENIRILCIIVEETHEKENIERKSSFRSVEVIFLVRISLTSCLRERKRERRRRDRIFLFDDSACLFN